MNGLSAAQGGAVVGWQANVQSVANRMGTGMHMLASNPWHWLSIKKVLRTTTYGVVALGM